MSEKEKDVQAAEDKKTVEPRQPEPMKYGVSPTLNVTIVRENRGYRFEMPIGAHLDECLEATIELQKIVTNMRDEAQKKAEEAKKKAGEGSASPDSGEPVPEKE